LGNSIDKSKNCKIYYEYCLNAKFQHQVDLYDAEIENNPLSRLLLEVKEMIFRIRDSISDLECLKFNGEADQCELVSAIDIALTNSH